MKIRRIRLTAYGRFSDVTIDLPDTDSEFHMFFGPNEAGKSTALKALGHMLFGMPARTSVNFLHAYTSLRVGATLVNRNGDQIEFLRRKGRAKTLRGGDDETVLDDDALGPFLGGVGADVFQKMFAIGHEDLIRGGEEIISGKGRVGEALFASGAGLIRLQNTQKHLEQACGTLFKPSGSTPKINQTIKSIRTVRKDQKEALLLPHIWQAHDRELRDAQKRLQEIKRTLSVHKQRRTQLERIKAALPLIARKKEIDASLVSYQGVVDLSDDFGENRRDAERDLKMAARDFKRSREAVEKLNRAIDALLIPEALLENAAVVESLQHELGSFRKAQHDRPVLEGRMRTLRKQTAESFEEIGEEMSGKAAKDFKLPPSTIAEIQNLGKAYERLTAQHEAAAEQHRKLANRFSHLTDQRQAMPAPVDVTPLENALQSAQEAGPIEKLLADMHTSSVTLESELNRWLKRQVLWKGSLTDIDELPLPSKENIDRFEKRIDASWRRIEKHHANKASTEVEVTRTQSEIQAIDLSHEVPSEADLSEARTRRDRRWHLLRQALDGKTPPAIDGRAPSIPVEDVSDLPDRFEESMVHADHIADRLRREADQVSRKGLLEARKQALEKSLGEIDARLEKVLAEHGELEKTWQTIWQPAGINPQTPKEMGGWLAGIASLREKLSRLQSQKIQTDFLTKQIAGLRYDLLISLDAAGAPQSEKEYLTSLIKTTQTHIKAHRDLGSRIAAADKELIILKGELEAAASAKEETDSSLTKWKHDWEGSLKKIGLQADTSPTAALAVIERVRDVKSKNYEADVLQKIIDGIDRDAAEFTARVDDLVEILASDLNGESHDRAAELLNVRLTTARKDESKRLGLIDQMAALEKEREAADRRIYRAKALLESLCHEAKATNTEALVDAERRARERRTLDRELNDLQKQLRELSAGATVEAFVTDAAAVQADSILPEIQELDDEMERLEKDRSALDQNIGALNLERKRMDGSSTAAMHAESAERLLAGLESDIEAYARLKVAAVMLSRTVEQYREKHQGPLITRASVLFSRMTLNAFSRLRADYDEKGNPVLVGIRSENDTPVHVEGMSDGTADQLYLALRLASLEQYLDNNEPLPFVVDDILLRFDDERALATLDVLAQLAEKTQILFFTHHQHLVALAQRAKAPPIKFNLHLLE